MSEHDPIREWSAQKERAEYVLKVAARMRNGEILHREAVAALLVAGVTEKLAAKALGGLRSDPTTGHLLTEPGTLEPDDPDPSEPVEHQDQAMPNTDPITILQRVAVELSNHLTMSTVENVFARITNDIDNERNIPAHLEPWAAHAIAPLRRLLPPPDQILERIEGVLAAYEPKGCDILEKLQWLGRMAVEGGVYETHDATLTAERKAGHYGGLRAAAAKVRDLARTAEAMSPLEIAAELDALAMEEPDATEHTPPT